MENQIANLTLPESANPEFILDYAGILQLLPHRPPFLFVEGVRALEGGKSIVCQKNFSFGDNFFAGHFPQEPVVPGVIQIEALAQASTLLMLLSFDDVQGKRPAFTGIDEAKFRRPVRPGDILTLNSQLEIYRRGFAVFRVQALVGSAVSAQGIIKATMI